MRGFNKEHYVGHNCFENVACLCLPENAFANQEPGYYIVLWKLFSCVYNFTENPFFFFLLCYVAWVNHFQLFTKCMLADFKNKNHKNKSACVWGGFALKECFSFLSFSLFFLLENFQWKFTRRCFFFEQIIPYTCIHLSSNPLPLTKNKTSHIVTRGERFCLDYESWKNWESFLRLESI